MTAPNKEAVEAAREKLARGRMAAWPGYPGGTTWENINQTQRDHWLGEVSPVDVESVAALPFLAPQTSQSDEVYAHALVAGYVETWFGRTNNDWVPLRNLIATALAAVRAEATLAGAVAEREACAKVAESHRRPGYITEDIAAAIRARKP